MKTLHIQLEDEIHRKLKQLAAEKDMSMKDLIVFFLQFDETPPATYLEETGYVDKKDVENIIIPDDPKIRVQSTPKNKSVGKPTKKNICPEHLVDRDICRLMKHEGNK